MVTREDLLEQSVMDFARARLQARGYGPPKVEWEESYPHGLKNLDHQIVAAGFNFDDEGAQAEMGSDLMTRLYTIEFFVFGTTATFARNIANALKFALQGDLNGTIPLLDYKVSGNPEIDRLIVEGASAHRQVITEPEPWQENVWTTTLHVRDEYFASLLG